MIIFDICGVEERIGYSFKDKTLLRKCFTHSSYANEHGQGDNELLEFFGDAIIQFVVTEYLYKNAKGDEGKLTQKRASLVSKAPLLKAVNDLDLTQFVLLGKGQGQSSKKDEKLYSSIYEAVVGGMYLDGGLAPVRKFIKETIISDFEKSQKTKVKNSSGEEKNKFQEFVQKNKLGSIRYETLSKNGPDHSPEFRVAALLNGVPIAEGKGPSKKVAEGIAAQKALKKISKGGKKR